MMNFEKIEEAIEKRWEMRGDGEPITQEIYAKYYDDILDNPNTAD